MHTDTDSPYLKMFKYDGSRQCESEGIDLDVMALELIHAGIDVVCSQKGSEGLAYAAVCGGDTGRINIYEIDRVNRGSAEALGFAAVTSLPDYQDQPCQL